MPKTKPVNTGQGDGSFVPSHQKEGEYMKLSLKRNLGNVDRTARIAIGLGLMAAMYNRTGLFAGFLSLLGAVQLIEGATGY